MDQDDDSWVQEFEIPKTFSTRTMDCISTGILSQSCRTEIVQTLAAHIWVHTHYPSKFAYNTICFKLVKVHPTLADDAGDEIAHVSINSGHAFYMTIMYNWQLSWKQKLRDRCKFLRRPPSGTSPLPKRKKIHSCESLNDRPSNDADGPSYDDDEFEQDVKVCRCKCMMMICCLWF